MDRKAAYNTGGMGFPVSSYDMKTTILKALLTLLSYLPLPAARCAGWLLGTLVWISGSRAATTTLINLRACLPDIDDGERRRLALKSLRHWGMTVFESPIIWRRGEKFLNGLPVTGDTESLDRLLAAGRGTIVLSPHLGNWELAGLWLSTLGPTTILYQPPRQRELEALVVRGRAAGGATLVPTNVRGVAAIIKALKRGEITGILPDMEPEASRGVYAPFFGVPALTMTLVQNLVQKTGAGVIFGFIRRVRGGFEMVLKNPVEGIESSDPVISATALNRTIESMVQGAPEQYQWEYKRFKRRPEGLAKLYR